MSEKIHRDTEVLWLHFNRDVRNEFARIATGDTCYKKS